MDMSSYQFVNTLAQCYEANAQLQGAGAAAAGSVGAATAPQDYYNMQSHVMSLDTRIKNHHSLKSDKVRGVVTPLGCRGCNGTLQMLADK